VGGREKRRGMKGDREKKRERARERERKRERRHTRAKVSCVKKKIQRTHCSAVLHTGL
jgi:hypothetical protein